MADRHAIAELFAALRRGQRPARRRADRRLLHRPTAPSSSTSPAPTRSARSSRATRCWPSSGRPSRRRATSAATWSPTSACSRSADDRARVEAYLTLIVTDGGADGAEERRPLRRRWSWATSRGWRFRAMVLSSTAPSEQGMPVAGPTGRELWNGRVAATPDRPFLRSEGRTRTFAETDAAVRELARGLAALGAGPGVRVLVGLSNRPETVPAAAGPAAAGRGARAPARRPHLRGAGLPDRALRGRDPRSPTTRWRPPCSRAATSGPGRCRWCSPPARCRARPARTVSLDELPGGGGPPPPAPPGYDEWSPVAILYTSGSTGRPKGVVLPSGSFYSCGQAFADRYGVGAGRQLLPAHAAGPRGRRAHRPSMALHAGCRLTVVDRFSPAEFWGQVAESGRRSRSSSPPTSTCCSRPTTAPPPRAPRPLRLVITHAWHEAFRERFGVELATVWGMTETGALRWAATPASAAARASSGGR